MLEKKSILYNYKNMEKMVHIVERSLNMIFTESFILIGVLQRRV